MIRNWNPGNKTSGVYRYNDIEHKHRMGSCKQLPKDGDLVVCIKPSGDCFNDYIIIRKNKEGLYIKRGEFGAYTFGDLVGILSKKDFHLLQAGESVGLASKYDRKK